MTARSAASTALLAAVLVLAVASCASATPLLYFPFNDSGVITSSSGSVANQTASFYVMSGNSTAIVAADLHTLAGTGVSGDIFGSPLYGTDEAFNASAGIALDTSSTAVSGLQSWTVSGWYKPSTSLIPGSAFFQTPGDNGFSAAGFAIRANDVDDLRIGVVSVSATSTVSTTSNSFDPINKWVFFAVTYDGSLTSNNVKVYEGFRNPLEATSGSSATVTLLATLTANSGTLKPSTGFAMGARLSATNYVLTGSAPSIIQSQPALFDDFRVDSGALSQSALEAYRVGDISIAANTLAWSSTASTSWDSGSNWTSGSGTTGAIADGAGQIALFGGPGTVGTATLASNRTLGGLTFAGSVGTTIGGSGTVTFNSASGTAAISATGVNAVNAPMVLSSSTSVALASASRLNFGASIGGGGSLTVAGSGQLTLSGSNSYSGTTSVSGGTLVLGNANALQGSTYSPAAGILALQPGIGSFNLGGITGTGNLVLADTAGGAVTLSAGGNNQDATYAGVISGAGGFVKTGTGTLTLTNANTITGNVTVSSGVLNLGNFYSLGSGGLVANGGTLDLGGFFRNAGGLSGAAGLITNNTAGAPATLIVNQSGNTTFSGAINDGLGSISLYKSGTGSLTLAGSNAYSGTTTIVGGVVAAGAAGALSPNAALYLSGSTLDVSGHSQSIQSLTMDSAATLNVGNYNILAITGAANFNGTLNGTLNVTGDTGAAVLMTYGGLYGRLTVPGGEIPSGFQLSYSSTALSIVPNGPAAWQAASGSWNDTLNWVGNSIPSGNGQQAVIGSATAAPVAITLDSPRTLGSLTISNSAMTTTGGYTLAPGSSGSLTMASSDGTAPQIVVMSGSNTIAANMTLTGSLQMTLSVASELLISGKIAESVSGGGVLLLSDSSAGLLVLSGANHFSAAVVEGGALRVEDAQALADGTSLTVGDASAFASWSAGDVASATSSGGSPLVTTVPEPGSMALLVLAICGGTVLWSGKNNPTKIEVQA